MSEASIVKVAGTKKRSLQQKSAGTLGIDRDKVKSFYKNPSKSNVYHQVRRVTKLTIRLIDNVHRTFHGKNLLQCLKISYQLYYVGTWIGALASDDLGGSSRKYL